MSPDSLQTPPPEVKLTESQADVLRLVKRACGHTIPREALSYVPRRVLYALVEKGYIARNGLGGYSTTALGEEASDAR